MDIDLAKALEQLEIKKRSINSDSDLSKECKSIRELDRRLGLLLKGIRTLRTGVEEQSTFTANTCDKLTSSGRILERTSQVFELSAKLTTLNRLCRRIDRIQAFNVPNDHLETNGRRSSLVKENSSINWDENDELTLQISEIIENFEAAYQSIESVLSQRHDLPYALYAAKVRMLKSALNGLSDATDINEAIKT